MKRVFFILIALIAASAMTLGAFAADAPTAADTSVKADSSTTEQGPSATSLPENDKNTAAPADAYESATKPLSTALGIIAKDFGMAKAGLVGEKLVFSRDDFRRALNVSEVGSITVTSLPKAESGRLLLGTTAITIGQKITEDNLDLVVFSPAADVACAASFGFIPGDMGFRLDCEVFMLTSVNETPVAAPAASASLDVSAHTDTPLTGKLAATDPEGDELRFEIVRYPSHGMLVLNDMRQGEYTYLPVGKYSGKDSFEYTVRDKYGNYAAAATVVLNVERLSSDTFFSDMAGNKSLNEALCAVDKGIMSAEKGENGLLCFNPDAGMTRQEFVFCAMKAAGISQLPDVTTTGFTDDAKIDSQYKNYIAAAKQLGYVKIDADANGCLYFRPEDKITRAEAAAITDILVGGTELLKGISAKPVFLDADSIPEDVAASLSNLSMLGMMSDEGGNINAASHLTRADAAKIVSALLRMSK